MSNNNIISEKNITREALIIAVYAEIQGMEIANLQMKAEGKAFAYAEEAFFNAAKELRKIANKEPTT